jgi:TonB family protein
MDYSHEELFRSIEFKASRQRSLWTSIAVHGVLLTVLLMVPLVFTDAIQFRYDTVLLAPPPERKPILEVTPYRKPPEPKPKIEKLLVAPPVKPLVVSPPEPKPPEPRKLAEIKLPEVVVPPPKPPRAAEPAPVAPAPKPEVRTGAFSSPAIAKPTTSLPAAQVQTGGFGDPNGIKGEGKPGKIANIASLGSFDLPTGDGAGNGTGGGRGTKGIVTNAGFGEAAATPDTNGASNRVVRQGGFGDAEPAKATAEASRRRPDSGPPQTPVEIVSKPKPDYTDEARRQRIEGEVLVRVLFSASGDVRVLDVVRGLGHGLDASALRAAQQIKFKPAQRDGQPVDSTATVHIVFQLAY